MPRCFETFCESGWQGQALQRLVDELHPGFTCEQEQCSPHSPGPISNTEEVAFLLIDPLHYDPQRATVLPDAFQELFNRDLSVIRLQYATLPEVNATRDELIERGKQKIPPKLRLVEEVCIGSVDDFRNSEDRLIAAYDTALEDKPAHASLFTRASAFTDRRFRKIVREHVHAVMTRKRISFSEFEKTLTGS